jgi:SAM-dependent methyltransferase
LRKVLMSEIDWLKLWSELVKVNYQPKEMQRMVRYKEHARKRSERPDPLLDFVISQAGPNDSVIDIGPGSGRWTIPLARKVKSVTAVEPTPEMAEILSENVKLAGLKNVTIVPERWENAEIQKHNICLCAHAMYSSPDLGGFVRKMEVCADKFCGLSIRIPPANGMMAELSEVIYGRRHDSPDAIIAFNALYNMGINANVMIEDGIVNWTNETLDEAFARAKRHLRVEETEQFDEQIKDCLKRKLVLNDGVYRWPDGMRSALLWWKGREGSFEL